MKVLSLDVATHTGFGLQDENGTVQSGTMDFSVKKNEAEYMRLLKFGDFVLQHIHNGVETIFYERTNFTPHQKSAAILNEFRGVLKYICAKKGVKLVQIPVNSIKKAVSGSGAAKKERIMQIIKNTYKDQNITTFDQSDALSILWTGCGLLGIERPNNSEEFNFGE